MEEIIKKLNFKGQQEIQVIRMPAELRPLFEHWSKDVTVLEDEALKRDVDFLVAFLVDPAHIAQLAKELRKVDQTRDPVLWFAYPKKSSKRYKTELSRDHGWEPMGAIGLEPVRQVALDDDWSALRFRPVKNIKSMTRSSALSKEGKERIKK